MHKITNKVLALALISTILFLGAPRAQHTKAAATPETKEDRIALYQALVDLTNPFTVMCIAAHPDDEDGTSLTVLRHKYGVHTVSLFSTFGEGGQNAIGPELYEELGAIRVRETMAAAEIQGSEPHFLGMKDFGFSKSADEAFKFWGHDEPLRRMVLQIRQLRPDVIITNHDTTSGHGHHQATGRLELEAFDAAANPQRFPEQLKDGVSTWQVQRLFVRGGFGGAPAANTSQNAASQAGIVTIDPNEQDPVRGTSYAEQALAALQKHATQGPWPKTVADMARARNATDGRLPLIRYRLVREAKGVAPLPADSHKFFEGIQLPDEVAKQLVPRPLVDISQMLNDVGDRSKVFAFLGGYYHSGVRPDSEPHLALQKRRLVTALGLAAGIGLRIELTKQQVTPGSEIELPFQIKNSGTGDVSVGSCGPSIPSSLLYAPNTKNLRVNGTGSPQTELLRPDSTLSRTHRLRIPDQIPINLPLPEHLYEPSGLGLMVNIRCTVVIANVPLDVETSIRVDVAPPVEIAGISPSPLVIRPPEVGVSSAGADLFFPPPPKFSVQLINHLDQPFKGELAFGQEGREQKSALNLLPHQSTTLAISIPRPKERSTAAHSRTPVAADSMSFTVRRSGSKEIISTRRVPVVWANAHVTRNLRVGYVRGFDFSLPNALSALGVESKELSVDEVKTADLQKFSTIIVDNRVYESEPALIAVNQRLLDYAKEGGTLVVFYHKSNEWNPDTRRNRPQLAPYPLTLGESRITDENAAITLTEPDHALLNFPNKIGQDDFKDWIQERGLYYPRQWDPQYHALLSANDPGEAPLTGGLLVADYGKGHYIYTSMVWYRQLRAGVPGGYRMFANMVSYGHK